MDIAAIFLQRYDPLYHFYLAGFWAKVPDDLMRRRPHERTNSIAWNLWHITRVEDAGVNRFLTDGQQVLDEGGWMAHMNLVWRHHGTEMTFAEVDELNERIDLPALRAYSQAVQERTRRLLTGLDQIDLEAGMEEDRLRQIMLDEGLAHSNAEGFVRNYLGWSRAKCLMSFALTHSWQHVGEMDVIAGLLGVDFE